MTLSSIIPFVYDSSSNICSIKVATKLPFRMMCLSFMSRDSCCDPSWIVNCSHYAKHYSITSCNFSVDILSNLERAWLDWISFLLSPVRLAFSVVTTSLLYGLKYWRLRPSPFRLRVAAICHQFCLNRFFKIFLAVWFWVRRKVLEAIFFYS